MVTTSRQQASARSRAEEEFLAAQKKSKAVVKEKERLHDEKSQHVAGLKAKRLAKEAAERDAAAAAPAVRIDRGTQRRHRVAAGARHRRRGGDGGHCPAHGRSTARQRGGGRMGSGGTRGRAGGAARGGGAQSVREGGADPALRAAPPARRAVLLASKA